MSQKSRTYAIGSVVTSSSTYPGIRRSIEVARIPETHRRLFLLCFASVIRNASNADPVPVSGLEVTAHMLRLEEAGRTVDPFSLFERAAIKAMRGMDEYWHEVSDRSNVQVVQADATRLRSRLRRLSMRPLLRPHITGRWTTTAVIS